MLPKPILHGHCEPFIHGCEWRNSINPDDEVPKDVLTCGDAVTLNRWLSLFVIEVRKKDGSKYPSKTIDLDYGVT